MIITMGNQISNLKLIYFLIFSGFAMRLLSQLSYILLEYAMYHPQPLYSV